MNICSKCGFGVSDKENLRLLTIEFLAKLNIHLGSPNFKDQHIFPVTEAGKQCEGSPEIYKILNGEDSATESSSNSTVSARPEMWRQAYARLLKIKEAEEELARALKAVTKHTD